MIGGVDSAVRYAVAGLRRDDGICHRPIFEVLVELSQQLQLGDRTTAVIIIHVGMKRHPALNRAMLL